MAKPFTWDFEPRNVTFKLRVFGNLEVGMEGGVWRLGFVVEMGWKRGVIREPKKGVC